VLLYTTETPFNKHTYRGTPYRLTDGHQTDDSLIISLLDLEPPYASCPLINY
jgi:hypothetical protein